MPRPERSFGRLSSRQPQHLLPRSACRRRAIATMVRYDTTNRHACGTLIRTIDRPTSWFAAKRRTQRARAASAPCFCSGCGAAPGPPRLHAAARGLATTHTAVVGRIHRSCARRNRSRRTGGPTDAKSATGRVCPHRGPADATRRGRRHQAAPVERCTHTHTRARPERTPRPTRTASSHPPRPFAAVPQDLPHEADARQEDGPESAHPAVDPHAHGQQDPLELEAAALAPHEARPLVELPKKRVRLSPSYGSPRR